MVTWKEIATLDTIQYSDSTEISSNKEYCLNCCYQLEETSTTRNGAVLLIKLENESTGVVASHLQIDGILDSSWLTTDKFVLAGALGNLYFYQYQSVNDSIHLNLLNSVEIQRETLCLSVDAHRDKVICSTSGGEVTILDSFNNVLSQENLHNFEAWTCHLSRHNDYLYYSGGDDCKFIGRDSRFKGPNLFSKNFEMGVTSIQSHPISDYIISTGSYNEELKIWDLRCMRSATSSWTVGGGVWRHKWCPDGGQFVLVAAMHAGFLVVDTQNTVDSLIRPTVTSHKDGLGYGVDWVRVEGGYSVCAASFYDHRWSLSQLNLGI